MLPDSRHRQIFWQDSSAHVNSYYFDKNNDAPPHRNYETAWRSRTFSLDNYRFAHSAPEVVTG
ncbi:hypothetical protein [Mycobacteroides sp. LB1]|uniref:hypothetical protein n=1 Tax=Mycobacteroides sp. LB1 TaxID=2750814 RepID=UPI0015E01C13|nr:hypothetical protein [Mycobacteroides sp. LB1]